MTDGGRAVKRCSIVLPLTSGMCLFVLSSPVLGIVQLTSILMYMCLCGCICVCSSVGVCVCVCAHAPRRFDAFMTASVFIALSSLLTQLPSLLPASQASASLSPSPVSLPPDDTTPSTLVPPTPQVCPLALRNHSSCTTHFCARSLHLLYDRSTSWFSCLSRCRAIRTQHPLSMYSGCLLAPNCQQIHRLRGTS